MEKFKVFGSCVLAAAGAVGLDQLVEVTRLIPGAPIQTVLLVWLVFGVGDLKRRVKHLETLRPLWPECPQQYCSRRDVCVRHERCVVAWERAVRIEQAKKNGAKS